MADAGSWGHYVAVFNAGEATLYVNGTMSSSKPVAGKVEARNVPFSAGRAAGGDGSYFRGSLDEIAVYDRALGVAEIAKHFTQAGR